MNGGPSGPKSYKQYLQSIDKNAQPLPLSISSLDESDIHFIHSITLDDRVEVRICAVL